MMLNAIFKLSIGLSCTFLTIIAPISTTVAQSLSNRPEYEHYFIGLDERTVLTSGTYTGLANPNYNRLTFLYPHIEADASTNHFHGIGVYSYTGMPDNPSVISTSINNRIPEYWTEFPPLTLFPGIGVFDNRLVSQRTNSEYTNLKMRPVQTLLEYDNDPATQYLYNSSGGRWQSLLSEAQIALELVAITPGLKVANEQGIDLLDTVGDIYTLGEGDNFSATPTFYTDKFAAKGLYSAEFRLLDLNNANGRTPLLPSGNFIIDFQVLSVPEPSSVLGFGLLMGWALASKLKQETGNR